MKYVLLLITFISATLFAQTAPQMPLPRPQRTPGQQSDAETLADNYQVTLTISDEDGQPVEVSVVTASQLFSASLAEQNLSFTGVLSVEDSGGIIIDYTLGWQSTVRDGNNAQIQQSSTRASVRLKLGEEVQIIRAGSRAARLSIKKLEASKPK